MAYADQRQRHRRRRHPVGTPGSRTTAVMWQNGASGPLLPDLDPCNDVPAQRQCAGTSTAPGRSSARYPQAAGPQRCGRVWHNGSVDRPGHARRARPVPRSASTTSGHIVGRRRCRRLTRRRGRSSGRTATMTNLGTLGDSAGPERCLRHQRHWTGGRLCTMLSGAQSEERGAASLWQTASCTTSATLVAASGWTIIRCASHQRRRARSPRHAGTVLANGVERALLLNPVGFVTARRRTRYTWPRGPPSAFFDTQIALLNPGAIDDRGHNEPTRSGRRRRSRRRVTVPARTRVTINPKLVPGLANAEFATRVDRPARNWSSTAP